MAVTHPASEHIVKMLLVLKAGRDDAERERLLRDHLWRYLAGKDNAVTRHQIISLLDPIAKAPGVSKCGVNCVQQAIIKKYKSEF